MKYLMKYIMIFIGFYVASSYDDLSRFKTVEQSPNRICPYDCGASLAVDGDTTSCMETNVIGGSAPENSMWWHVDLGDTYCIRSISIVFKSFGDNYGERDKGRIAGFSLFLSNSTSKEKGWRCYKNGPELPPLNFSTDCIGHGRYVIYYNERINGVTYPEKYQINSYNYLCEVIVKGCLQKGVYGSDCNTPCPENCQHQRCHIVNGSCLDCKLGWTGHMCSRKCSKGWFGPGCTHQCVGHCVNNGYCNHMSGLCNGGCASGWTGSKCDKECEKGMYGINCVHNCSGNCYNNSYCNKISGHCDMGCGPGYFGNFCEKWIVASSGDSGSPLTSVVIVAVLTVVIILAVVIIFFIRRRIVRNIKTSKKYSENNGTENIQVVSENVNEYQELTVTRNNNEYQIIRLSEVTSVEQRNTYQNLVLTEL